LLLTNKKPNTHNKTNTVTLSTISIYNKLTQQNTEDPKPLDSKSTSENGAASHRGQVYHA